MNFGKINRVTTENELNKLLRRHKRDGSDLALLFVSPWDKVCNRILEEIPLDEKSENTLNVVDLFEAPHASVIFRTTKVPHLVLLGNDSIMTDDYVSRISGVLGL